MMNNAQIFLVRDNIDLLKDLHNSNTKDLDLIYIDPPFNKGRVFTDSLSGFEFSDSWSNYGYKDELNEIGQINPNLYSFLNNLEVCLPGSYINYLTAMGIRCWYMRELLKDTGSFYFHCDDTIGHYMKCVLDYVFGIDNFRNQITWKRMAGAKIAKYNYPRTTDTLLYYTKSKKYTFNPQYRNVTEKTLATYRLTDEYGRKYKLDCVIDPYKGVLEWNIDGKVIKHPKGRGFIFSQSTLDKKRKEHFEKYGTEFIQVSKNGIPRQVLYLENSKGAQIDNNWIDVHNLVGSSKERLDYPTQKPEALLERIIISSSNPGDKVADFYLGSGTTAAVAIRNGRSFIGCDINKDAVDISIDRVKKIC